MCKFEYVDAEEKAYKYKTYDRACHVLQYIGEKYPDILSGININSNVDYYTISLHDKKKNKRLGYLANRIDVVNNS